MVTAILIALGGLKIWQYGVFIKLAKGSKK